MLILIVLSNKKLRNSGINVMMMIIAFCDFLCALVAVIRQSIKSGENNPNSYFQAQFYAFYSYITISFHTCSICLGVGMAFCRVMSLYCSKKAKNWNTPKYTIIVAIIIICIIFVTAIPIRMINEVVESEHLYISKTIDSLQDENCFVFRFILFLVGVFYKIIPCLLLIIFFVPIFYKLKEKKAIERKILSIGSKKTDTSIYLTLSVLIIFIITELPQGIFNSIGVIFVVDFMEIISLYLGDLVDTLSILNSLSTFIIYSVLSSAFRNLFVQLFIPKWMCKADKKTTNIRVKPPNTIT
ncbi:unnamed protein product [Caenorhabditis angaria]|uniref:G-protein coupled receptors family 1 profile domain-containing protein n=1 Tax=Caenorhabditis angaria TaxID=860376 RepID=A0A9P1N5H6_9PELO|nr:unnamed protein product [Caenorhabditis angaria]